jgi:hypothetical protein
MVSPGRSPIFSGRFHRRENQILPYTLTTRLTIRQRGWGFFCRPTITGALHETQDGANEEVFFLPRTTHPATLSIGRHRRSQLSQFLRHLHSLAPDVPDYLLRGIWIRCLLSTIQTHLAGRPDIDLETAAHCADCIMETISSRALTSAGQPVNDLNAKQCLNELFRRLEALGIGFNNSTYRERRCHASQSRYHQRVNRSSSRDGAPISYCWYHRRYGASARKCYQPCTFTKQEK